MSVGPLPPNFANAISPFAPVGKQSVGEESKDLKNSTLKAVVRSADSARTQNRRGKSDVIEGEYPQEERLGGEDSEDPSAQGELLEDSTRDEEPYTEQVSAGEGQPPAAIFHFETLQRAVPCRQPGKHPSLAKNLRQRFATGEGDHSGGIIDQDV